MGKAFRTELLSLKNLISETWAAYCLHFAYYNLCRIHKTLRVTPAMEAGITDRVWEIRDLLQ
jgi:hypothetical protein